ncbi:hypothetical protein ACFQ0D_02945, partial [Micromonospora zhanjiangensis]
MRPPETRVRLRPLRPLRPLTAVALLGGAALIALLAVTVIAPHPTVAGVLGLVVVVVCLTALYQATRSGFFAPVAVTFWAFVVVWVGFAPLLQIRDRVLPWPDTPLYQFYVTAQVILLFAVLSFWAGYQRSSRSESRRDTPGRVGRGPRAARRGRLARWTNGLPSVTVTVEKALVVTAFAAGLTVVCLPRTGGLAVRFADRDTLDAAIVAAGLRGGRDLAMLGLLSTLPAAAGVVALVLCLLCWRNRSARGRRGTILLTVATVVAGTVNLIYNNPLSATRFASFSVLLAAGFALLRFDRRRWRVAFSWAILLGLLVLYPLANLFRNEQSRQDLRVGLGAYYTYDFDGFQQTVNDVYYVSVHGHTWGHHIASALLFWVPRSLWEGKAIGAGNVLAASRGYQFQNLSLPFWAEVYLEFSLLGVIVLFYFYGRLARRLDLALRERPAGLGTLVTVVFAACQIGLLRGSLGGQIPFAGAAFAVALTGVTLWRGAGWGLTRSPGERPAAESGTAAEPATGPAAG